MSRFPELLLGGIAALLLASSSVSAADVAAGEKAFGRCKACHAVGEGASNRVGPHLNELIGREAGTVDGYSYSAAMTQAGEGGLVWDEASLKGFLANPKGLVKGTKMAFAGLKKDQDLENVIAYLATFSAEAEKKADGEPKQEEPEKKAKAAPAGQAPEPAAPASAASPAQEPGAGAHFKLGREATEAEVAAWDIDVRPDGLGLPEGRGTVAQGQELYDENCASCHGDFGEAIGRWPVLAGGQGTLTDERPEKTVGSYWPYLSTVYDYVRRAMPFGNARSLSDDDVYALTAYILYLNDVVDDEDFELSKDNFASIKLSNEDNFIDDDRDSEPHYARDIEPCMTDCIPGKAEIKMHAAVLDVTPENAGDDDAPAGGID
ncbi:c-type cytochrome [Pseudaminobacter salicylatoxidans]|uniref:c-type cytochrome n=1 Tax=Pseudaminobacter salicylatoxidans TaxID=93369 RepID=UPI0004751F57|nr:c-type cytochrome [Pseudaminobacter salicylatoxidans]